MTPPLNFYLNYSFTKNELYPRRERLTVLEGILSCLRRASPAIFAKGNFREITRQRNSRARTLARSRRVHALLRALMLEINKERKTKRLVAKNQKREILMQHEREDISPRLPLRFHL